MELLIDERKTRGYVSTLNCWKKVERDDTGLTGGGGGGLIRFREALDDNDFIKRLFRRSLRRQQFPIYTEQGT